MIIKKKRWLLISISLLTILTSAFIIADQHGESVDKNLQLFNSFFKILDENFVDELNPEKLMRVAIDATTTSLDPYSHFYNERETEDRKKSWKGILYAGIGAQVNEKEGRVYIVSVNEKFPAQVNDLRPGDFFLKINDEDVSGKSRDEVVKLLKGEPETIVRITVERPGVGTINKNITRKNIVSLAIPYYGFINTETAYIKLAHFLEGSSDALKTALQNLKSQGCKKLIIDLRDNNGGLVQESVDALNIFLAKNTPVLFLKNKKPDFHEVYQTRYEPIDTILPIVLLTNGKTISAGEIFAGALQDLDRAVIIGSKTFGKGFVQATRFPGFNTSMYFTVARYHTPSGRCIQQLDYSKKYSEGKVSILPDSLKKEFFTKNHRKVYNIGGIDPDIKMDQPPSSIFISYLDNSSLFFDFSNQYRNTHDTPINPESFAVSEKDYHQFQDFVKKSGYNFKTDVEKEFDNLLKKFSTDSTNLIPKKYFQPVINHLYQQKVKDFYTPKNKSLIKKRLEEEIIKRYHYDSGVYRYQLKADPEILKSLELFSNLPDYYRMLKP